MVITGTSAADSLVGTDQYDQIYGYEGDDTLDSGGGGEDDLYGGLGNDLYLVDSDDDWVFENSLHGTDTVYSTVDFDLYYPAGSATAYNTIENLVLLGTAVKGWGNNLNNIVSGNDIANDLRGDPGNDTLSGAGGKDSIYGDAGHDVLLGDVGSDFLYGGTGNDSLDGGAGNDRMDAGSGNDIIAGSAGQDTAYGGSGGDFIFVSPEATVSGLRGDPVLRANGGAGNDTISGASGPGLILADYSNSAGAVMVFFADGQGLDGSGGVDVLVDVDGAIGSSHADGMFEEDTVSGSILEGMGGNDTLAGLNSEVRYGSSPGAVKVNLATTSASDGWGGTDTLIGISRVGGSNFSDSLTGSILKEEFEGLGGNDTIRGGPSNFEVDFDWVRYNRAVGAVTVDLGAGTGQGSAGTIGVGTDKLFSIEGVRGSDFNDSLRGGGEGGLKLESDDLQEIFDLGSALLGPVESFEGRAGNDTLDGGDTSVLSWDSASYADSPYAVIVNLGASQRVFGVDTVEGATALDGYGVNGNPEGVDTLININGAEGSGFADIIIGSDNPDRIFAGGDNDYVEGGGGNDVLDGGFGDDTIYGGEGDDIFLDSQGSDTMYGEGGDDVFGAYDPNFSGIVQVTGGSGRDSYVLDPESRLFDITDFTPGEGGDFLYAGQIFAAAALAGFFEGGDPISQGYIYFQQDGENTHVVFDNDAAGDVYLPFTYHILLGVNAGDLTFDNISGLLLGSAGNDTLVGGDFGEVLIANEGADVLDGGAGADTMLGGLGADSMVGGAGSDVYVVDDLGDDVVEEDEPGGLLIPGGDGPGAAGASTTIDTVISSINYSLAGLFFVENLVLAGAASHGAGNILNNQLTGNGGNDTLLGDAGSDTIDGGTESDRLDGGAGNDNLHGGAGSDSLNGGAGNDFLTWSSADTIQGGSGTDTLVILAATANLTAIANTKIANIEQIDLSTEGNHKLILNASDVLDLSTTTNTIKVLGAAGDTVDIVGAFTAQAIAGGFRTYKVGTGLLQIDIDIAVS